MPQVYRVLGQLNPAAATPDDIYTVLKPIRSAILSSINVWTRSATPTTFRIAIRKGGAALALEQYIAYDTPITANDTISFNIGISLAQTDIVTVYATLATVTFNVFGLENA